MSGFRTPTLNQSTSQWRSDFWAGTMTVLPALIAASPFAILLGALATDKGLTPLETGLMSAMVFAGGSQYVALETWQSPPVWMMLGLATFIVNLRHIFMSASVLRHMGRFPPRLRPIALCFLTDETWAFAEARASKEPLTPAFYLGLTLFFYLNWVLCSVLGAFIGQRIHDPKVFGFDFAFTAIFISLVMAFRQRPGFIFIVLASLISAAGVHYIYPGPLSIIVGTLAGTATAAFVTVPKATHRRESV